MDNSRDVKRKRNKHSDDDEKNSEKRKSKRGRSRSRSPGEVREREPRRKRKHSRSGSPEKRVKDERRNNDTREVRREAPERKVKETDMLNTRTGGAYIPPARLRMMQAQITDKSSAAYQRLAWEALKKSIHGHINKINVGNIGIIIKELLKENIVRGRGLLCRSVIQAQAASPTFTNVYAALVAAVNSRFPNIGELLLKRLVIQFKRGFKRNDKPICISSASFIAHLVNQRVAHEILALELLTLLVETPTDDSIEVAIAFLKECGQKLTEVSSKGVNAIFEMLRNILHEGQLDKRVQYMIEVMFQVWKDEFKDHPAVIEELELVPEEEQFTHLLMLDDATDSQDILNVFKFDDKYEENEQKYKTLSKEILGSDAESDGEDGSGESGSEGSDEEEDGETAEQKMTIIDNTETNLVALRRTIYLTINSSLDFEECAHKLMKMQLKPGQEVELCHMFLDCCAEQRTYEKFYGLLAQRFCNINRIYIGPFEEIFKDSYSTAHRLDTNRLRNVSKFFAHLLFTDSIGWEVLDCVKLNEEDTTSSSRIYIKILFQELAEYMGLKKLNDRLKDPTLQDAFQGVFPRDNPKNTRFSINFFTSIGLGGLTDELREHLKQMPKNMPPPVTEIKLDSDSSSDSSSSSSSDSSSDSSSSSDSEAEGNKPKTDKTKSNKKKNKDKSPKTPQEKEPEKDKERWGHDGFYDTYGKDARRVESRPDRDRENFVRPRDKHDDRRYRDERDGDYRRDDRRREDRGESGRDDERRNRDERNSNKDERNRNRDERISNREERDGDYRREDRRRENRGDSGRDDERRNRDERISNREDRDGDNRRIDRRREDRGDSGRDDERRNREERNSNKEEKEEDYRREDRRREDREESGRDDERRSRDERNSNKEERISNRDERPSNREGAAKKRDDDRDRRYDDYRSRKEDRSRKDETRSESNEDTYRKKGDKNRKEDRKADSDDDVRRRRDKSEKDKKKDSDDDSRRREDKSEKGRKEERARKEEESRTERIIDDKKRSDKGKRKDRKEESDDEPKKRGDKSDKNKKKDGEDSEDESRSRRYEKENRNKERKDQTRSSKRDESSSSEDERSQKHDKKKGKENNLEDEGWDIRRGSSIRREITVGRYWDN